MRSCAAAASRRRHCAAAAASTAARGSSSSSTAGRAAKARTKAACAACPPERSRTLTWAISSKPAAEMSCAVTSSAPVTMVIASVTVASGGNAGFWVSMTLSEESAMRRSSVVLPAPLTPTTAVVAWGRNGVSSRLRGGLLSSRRFSISSGPCACARGAGSLRSSVGRPASAKQSTARPMSTAESA